LNIQTRKKKSLPLIHPNLPNDNKLLLLATKLANPEKQTALMKIVVKKNQKNLKKKERLIQIMTPPCMLVD